MNDKHMEFTGGLSIGHILQKDAFWIIEGEDGERRLFELPSREYAINLQEEWDTERHKRYDLEMDTSIVFTINKWSQCIVFYRWKIMRQLPELIRYIVDQARLSEFKNGGLQDGFVCVQRMQPILSFPITEEVMEAVHKALIGHPNVVSVERNGGWFTFTVDFSNPRKNIGKCLWYISYAGREGCSCNNDPHDLGECAYEKGVKKGTEKAFQCSYFK